MNNFNDNYILPDEIWVYIDEHREVPFIGRGPFYKPVRMSKENYQVLKNLGYKMKPLDKVELMRQPLGKYFNKNKELVVNKLNEQAIPAEPVKQEQKEEVVPEVVEPEIVEEVVEHIVVEEKRESSLDEKESLSVEELLEEVSDEEVYITEEDIDAMTKVQLKELLDFMEIPYKYKDTVGVLKKLAKENCL